MMESSTTGTTRTDVTQAIGSKEMLVSAVNSKDNVESIKGRIITTNKMLKYLEATEKEKENAVANLKLQIKRLGEENQLLNQQIKTTNDTDSLPKTATPNRKNDDRKGDENEMKKRINDLERALKMTMSLKIKAEETLSGRRAYISQLEAQSENLGIRIKELEAVQRKKDRVPSQLKDQEATIMRMKMELEELTTANEALEDEKMEVSINYDMMQTAHTDTLEELQQLKKKLEDAELKLQQKDTRIQALSEDLSKTKSQNVDCHEMDELRAKLARLQQQGQQPESDEHSTAMLSNPAGQDYVAIVTELRQLIADNQMLMKEKRVLQDKYTEQLVINAELETSQKNVSLSRFIPEYTMKKPYDRRESVQDDIRNIFSPIASPTLYGTSEDALVYSHRYNSRHVSPQSRRSLSSETERSKNSMNPVSVTGRQSVPILADSDKSLYRDADLIPPEPILIRTTSPSPRPRSKLSKLEKIIRARLPSSLASPSRKRASDVGPSVDSFKKKKSGITKIPDTTAPTLNNYVELIRYRIEEFSKHPPEDTVNMLEDMEDFTTWKSDVLLGSLEAFYQNIRSHSKLTLSKAEGFIPQMQLQGVPDEMALECPVNMDNREKNIAWMLWSLSCMYPAEKPYQKYTSWATRKAMKHIKDVKVQTACRYTRLLCMLCKKANDLMRIRSFCLDMMRWSSKDPNFIYVMVNVAMVWKEVLSLGSSGGSNSAGANMIIKTISCISAETCKDTNAPDSLKALYAPMPTLCGWPELEFTPSLEKHIEELTTVLIVPDFKSLFSANLDAFEDLRFNLVKSLELAFWRLDDWLATYDKFILTVLWPLVEDDILADVCFELMGLLGRCGLSKGSQGKEKPGVKVLREKLTQVLELGNACPDEEFMLQVTAAKSVILLSNDQTSRLKPVLNWFVRLKPAFMEQIPSDIRLTMTELRRASEGLRL